MLVLTRKRDESIIIGDHIRVTVVEVRGDQVKLGIDAPRSIPVHREEVYREILEENRKAALSADVDVDGLAGSSPRTPGKRKPRLVETLTSPKEKRPGVAMPRSDSGKSATFMAAERAAPAARRRAPAGGLFSVGKDLP